VTRDEAILRLAQHDIRRLTAEERAEQLGCMLLEDWASDPRWSELPAAVRAELEEGELEAPASDRRYDPVLALWLRARCGAVTNGYLENRLREHGDPIAGITGMPEPAAACPCCGCRTLGSRGNDFICPVCWWQDDGQDNRDADTVRGGPNHHLSLTQARANVLEHGIADPARHDLQKMQDPPAKYECGRTFTLSADRTVVSESGTAWRSAAFRR
jgi:hypothetical protein